jgi:hypothetical protein
LELLRRYESGPYPATVPALLTTAVRSIALSRFAFRRS